jgi:hypothetical protein
MQPMGTCRYGGVGEVAFQEVEGRPDLLALKTTVGIPCGTDSSLYLFRRRALAWSLDLAVESNGYEEVSGALGAFAFAVTSHPGADYRVVTADVNPWCTSNWQSLRSHVYLPGPEPYAPLVVADQVRGIFLGMGDPYYKLLADADGYSLYFPAEQGLEGGYTRQHVERFAIVGDTVARTRPLAVDRLGFVLEGLDLAWEQAGRHSDPAHPDLERWHRIGRLARRTMQASGDTENPVRGRMVVLGFERKPCPLGDYGCDAVPWAELRFTVGERSGQYYMASVDVANAAASN